MLYSSGMYCLIFVGVAFAENLPHDTKHTLLGINLVDCHRRHRAALTGC